MRTNIEYWFPTKIKITKCLYNQYSKNKVNLVFEFLDSESIEKCFTMRFLCVYTLFSGKKSKGYRAF